MIRCVACVVDGLLGKQLGAPGVVAGAEKKARPAATIYQGDALCTRHFTRVLVQQSRAQDAKGKHEAPPARSGEPEA